MNHDLVLPIWKPLGWTPLMVVNHYKKLHPENAMQTISYAGRLDPMAEGVLLLLIGKENKRRTQYEALEKTYETEMILGIRTDSLDALGIVTDHQPQTFSPDVIKDTLKQFIGTHDQSSPIYSSRAVRGKPLYWWARQHRIGEITIPTKTITIFSLDLLTIDTISTQSLHELIEKKIYLVAGNFRQPEILSGWRHFFGAVGIPSFTKVSIRLSCTSGTYVRQLVADIGQKLGCGAFALSITRTRVGMFMHNSDNSV